jgi:hypothetical protein
MREPVKSVQREQVGGELEITVWYVQAHVIGRPDRSIEFADDGRRLGA